MTHKDTELREQIGDCFARSCKNNEYFGNDGWYELHTPTLREEIEALIAQREQAAELQGKTTVLKKLASKTTPRYEDTHPEYTKGFEEMKSKVKFELQRLQATKPEKGEQP